MNDFTILSTASNRYNYFDLNMEQNKRLKAINFIDKNVSEMDKWKFIERETYVQLLIKQEIIVNYTRFNPHCNVQSVGAIFVE